MNVETQFKYKVRGRQGYVKCENILPNPDGVEANWRIGGAKLIITFASPENLKKSFYLDVQTKEEIQKDIEDAAGVKITSIESLNRNGTYSMTFNLQPRKGLVIGPDLDSYHESCLKLARLRERQDVLDVVGVKVTTWFDTVSKMTVAEYLLFIEKRAASGAAGKIWTLLEKRACNMLAHIEQNRENDFSI